VTRIEIYNWNRLEVGLLKNCYCNWTNKNKGDSIINYLRLFELFLEFID
jgi:hypothetical protein